MLAAPNNDAPAINRHDRRSRAITHIPAEESQGRTRPATGPATGLTTESRAGTAHATHTVTATAITTKHPQARRHCPEANNATGPDTAIPTPGPALTIA